MRPVDDAAQSMYSASSTLLSWAYSQHQQFQAKSNSSNPKSITASRLQVRVQPGFSDTLTWLRHHPYHQKLYFRSRQQRHEVAAVGFLHVATGAMFDEAHHVSMVSALDPSQPMQRFYGAMRFDDSPDSGRDPEWAQYDGFTFVLPAVELFRDSNGRFVLAANFYLETSIDILAEVLRSMTFCSASVQTMDPTALMPQAHHVSEPGAFRAWDSSMGTILKDLKSGRYEKIVLARRKHFQFHPCATPTPMQILGALDEQNKRLSSLSSGETATESMSDVECYDGVSSNLNASGDAVKCISGMKEATYASSNRDSYLFCLQLNHEKAFLGCPPERLFHLEVGTILTEALAGTVRRGPVGNEGEVLSELLSAKNLEEHRLVVDYIHNALQKCGVHAKTNGPHIRRLPRLMHLATHIRGEFPQTSSLTGERERETSSRSLGTETYKVLRTMHPTAAVCGAPRESTIAALRRLECFDRGLFAGPFGWISRDGGEFCVAIRSALVHGNKVTAFAGSGIVPGSESKSEWDETELKLSAFTDLFRGQTGSRLNGSANPLCSDAFHLEDMELSPHSVSTTEEEGISAKPQEHRTGDHSDEMFRSDNLLGMSVNGCTGRTDSYLPSVTGSTNSMLSFLSNATAIHSVGMPRNTFDPSDLHICPNLNSLWGCCTVEELCRNGVRTFFVSPGSRSAPLAVGVARSRHAVLYVAHDERGAGFQAVGYARGTGRAAAVICSSGTAVANLLPAVVEAFMDSLPLVLLTADRPPELRDVGANQAIEQPDIFGRYTRWRKDMPCPSEDIPLRNLLSDIDYAVYMSGSGSLVGSSGDSPIEKGPVHLNMMFREKLAPDSQAWNREYIYGIGKTWMRSLLPFTEYSSGEQVQLNTESDVALRGGSGQSSHGAIHRVLRDLWRKRAGVVIVGGSGILRTEDDLIAILEIADFFGWPVIPDVCSGLRFDKLPCREVVHYADQIFASHDAAQALLPDVILQFGERITSKRVSEMIHNASLTSADGFAHVVISTTHKRFDASFTVTHRIRSSVLHVLASLMHIKTELLCCGRPTRNGKEATINKLAVLPDLSRKVDSVLQNMMQRDKELTEPQCIRAISEWLMRPSALFIGNSMPIRDFDAFARASANGTTLKVAANRGASGIDGLLSSGIGFGVGLKLDVTIVIGDMSMIHDLNALHLLRAGQSMLPITVTVVVVNNGGGGIFSLLPIAKHRNVFTPIFDTPHSVKFEKACEMFGIDYFEACSVNELRTAITSRKAGNRHRLIEAVVSQDHASNAALHQRLSAAVSQELSTIFAAPPKANG